MEDDEALTGEGIIRTIYDPTAGTGGFLSEGMEYVEALNPQAVMRAYGQERTPFAMLSHGKAGVRGQTLIVTLPGSTKGVTDSLDALIPSVRHALKMMRGGGHKVGTAEETAGRS